MNSVISSPAPAQAAALHHQHQRGGRTRRRQREAGDVRLLSARRGFGAAVASVGRACVDHRARERAEPDERTGRQQPPAPPAAQPTDTYFDELHKLPDYFNGEAVIVYHAPAGQHRRRQPRVLPPLGSDQRRQSVLDGQLSGDRRRQGRQHSGRHRGLNQILDLAVAEYRAQGGTWIIPGRGRLSDTADVASYRNMVDIIRDRVQDLIRQGHDARSGEGREADHGLRRPLRIDDRCLDDGHVRGSGVSEPPRRSECGSGGK